MQQSSGLFAVFESDAPGKPYKRLLQLIVKAARNKGMYKSFSTFFAEICTETLMHAFISSRLGY